MFEVILLIIGAVAGFCLYKMVIMSDSRQRTINNKTNTFDSITESWTEMRHFILANHKGKLLSREANNAIDEMHKNSQQLIDKLNLENENQHLISDINGFNESIYQNEWDTLDLKKLSAVMDQLKTDSSVLAVRMREDINNSYRLEWQDLKSCITTCFCSNETCNESPTQSSNKSPDSATSNTATSSTEYKDDWIEVLLKSKFNFLKDWDIRSLSKRKVTVTEEPVAESKPKEEAPSPENKGKKAEPAADVVTKPKKAEPAAESKLNKTESATESKPKKEKASPGDKSK
jgi:hypothetical protein